MKTFASVGLKSFLLMIGVSLLPALALAQDANPFCAGLKQQIDNCSSTVLQKAIKSLEDKISVVQRQSENKIKSLCPSNGSFSESCPSSNQPKINEIKIQEKSEIAKLKEKIAQTRESCQGTYFNGLKQMYNSECTKCKDPKKPA